MMSERFITFTFWAPMPMEERVIDFPHCGRCAAKFYLQHGQQTSLAGGGGPSAAEVAAPLGSTSAAQVSPNLVGELERLARLHASCCLTVDEFHMAKRMCLRG